MVVHFEVRTGRCSGFRASWLPQNQLRIQNQRLLATKAALPEFYQMNQKEVMYTNTVNQWKTSVTRFIQGLSQQDQLDLQKMIVYKKRADDVYNIGE